MKTATVVAVVSAFFCIAKVASGQNCGFNFNFESREVQFHCRDGSGVFPWQYYCDNVPDCYDNSDEEYCYNEPEPVCEENQFLCPQPGPSGEPKCIPESYLCDGDNDCGDYSDESPEICGCPRGMTHCSFYFLNYCIPEGEKCHNSHYGNQDYISKHPMLKNMSNYNVSAITKYEDAKKQDNIVF